MNMSNVELPSNRNFGFFFTGVFGSLSAYLYVATSMPWAYSAATVSVIFLIVTFVKDDILLPLNKLWMRFGLLLGMIVSPIVFGVIFFGIFTPIGFVMRLSGRDELRLKFKKKPSHWVLRSELIHFESFKEQF